MPRFTIETTYRMPYYRHAVYDAATPEEACRLAMEDHDWSRELPDHECAGPTYITGIWKGGGAAYEGKNIPVPSQFDETNQRKADHFTELLDQLASSPGPWASRSRTSSAGCRRRWQPWKRQGRSSKNAQIPSRISCPPSAATPSEDVVSNVARVAMSFRCDGWPIYAM